MIKNLIGAIGMTLISTVPNNKIDFVNSSVDRETQATTKTNIFNADEYENGNLTVGSEYATIQYQEININNNVSIKNRSRINTVRIPEGSYEINITCLTEVSGNYNINNIDITYYLNPPLRQYISNTTSYEIGHFTSLTAVQDDFLNGANYDSYVQIANLALMTGYTNDDADTIDQTYFEVDNSYGPYNYYYCKIYLVYDETTITDSGSSLLNNINALYKIKYHLEWTAQINPTDYEVIDIAGLMFEILGMPFAWFSMAFNFTLFPGTPYAINISHLLLGILVSLIAIIIFKIIWSGR